MAAVRPAGPPPTTATSTVKAFAMIVSLRRSYRVFGPKTRGRQGRETMIRRANSASPLNGVSVGSDRYHRSGCADPSDGRGNAAVRRSGAAEADRAWLHR